MALGAFRHPAAQGAAPLVYEVEDHRLLGIVAKKESGFTGWAYIGRFDREGDFTELEVFPAKAGNYTATFRFANDSGASATRNLYVNGAKTGEAVFPAGASWNAWQTSGAKRRGCIMTWSAIP